MSDELAKRAARVGDRVSGWVGDRAGDHGTVVDVVDEAWRIVRWDSDGHKVRYHAADLALSPPLGPWTNPVIHYHEHRFKKEEKEESWTESTTFKVIWGVVIIVVVVLFVHYVVTPLILIWAHDHNIY